MKSIGCALVFALALGAMALAGETGLQTFLAQTGLDSDLVTVLAVDAPGGALGFVCVYVTERTLNARMGPTLAETLPAYVGRNAILVLVSAEQKASFAPTMLVFVQGEQSVIPRAENTVSVMGDFLSGEVAADMATVGLILLGDAIDPAAPFSIVYGDVAQVTMVLDVEPATLATAGAPETSDPEPETFGLVPEAVPESPEPDACCDPCAFLCGWWTRPCDPCDGCDPCELLRGGLMFLLLLLGL